MELLKFRHKSFIKFAQSRLSWKICDTLCTCTATEQSEKYFKEVIELVTEETNLNANLEEKRLCTDFRCFSDSFGVIVFSFLKKIQCFGFCRKTNIRMKGYLTFCRDASLHPPGVRLITLRWPAVQFNPNDNVSCEIESTFGLRTG